MLGVLQLLLYLKELNELYDAINTEHIYALYVNFKKNLDKVADEKLLEKLPDINIGGKQLNLISSSFRERKQCVKVNNTRASFRNVTSGVSQGSILRPHLFFAYVSDLPKTVDNY